MSGRYARQVRLTEIGVDGQAKIACAEVIVPRGRAGWVARRYLEGAGVGAVRAGDFDAPDPRFEDLDAAARDVALGARFAAATLLAIVGKR